MNIGIVGALDEEILHYKNGMKIISEEKKTGIIFYIGTFNDIPAVICKSGVGKVNASICSQILIDHYSVTHIIFTGVAGALDPILEIGDIVISTDSMQHDMDATALGFKLGEIPYSDVYLFKADLFLHNLAFSISKEMINQQKVISGRILSGDQFIADREKVIQLYHELGGACTEMEGAAVAQVCYLNQIPFVIIRSISDKADGSADVNFLEFTELASFHSFKIVNSMLINWK